MVGGLSLEDPRWLISMIRPGREAIERVGLWLPERVDNMIAQLRKGADPLDNMLGLVLSTQILHELFIENPSPGDPNFPMVDRSGA